MIKYALNYFFLLMTFFGLLSTTLAFVNADETTSKDEATIKQEGSAEKSSEKSSVESKLPDKFDPSEEISEGLSVSFPVDI